MLDVSLCVSQLRLPIKAENFQFQLYFFFRAGLNHYLDTGRTSERARKQNKQKKPEPCTLFDRSNIYVHTLTH